MSMRHQLLKGAKNPLTAASYIRQKVSKASRLTLSSHLNIGTNLLQLDWDLLIVLDSCRVDALREVASTGEFDFLTESGVKSLRSVGGSTGEWAASTFTPRYKDEIARTGFVEGNAFPYKVLEMEGDLSENLEMPYLPTDWEPVPPGSFREYIPAWQHGGRSLTDRYQSDSNHVIDHTIDLGRRNTCDRVISHLIEPHYPYVAAAKQRGADELNETEQKPWPYLRNGGDLDVVWENYLTELRAGLGLVDRLLRNYDAENVIITADHGESFGEYGFYGHQTGSFNPHVRTVPLVRTSATDTEEYKPTLPEETEEVTVNDRLRHLGYID